MRAQTVRCWVCDKLFCLAHIHDCPRCRESWLCPVCESGHMDSCTMAAQGLVWRANVKTEPPDEGIDPYQFCLERSIYGIGWAVEGLQTRPDWSSYLDLAATIYETSQTGARSWHNGAMFIKSSIRPNDLIWIRDYAGTFWLGRIDGEWEYSSGRDFVGADVVNTRVCRWVKVPVDDVPGSVAICRGLFRAITDGCVREYSKLLYNQLNKEGFSYAFALEGGSFFSFLSPDACEDLVAFYVQSKGFWLVPSSCKRSTARYEFSLVERGSGKTAVVQVKNGKESLSLLDYSPADVGADSFVLFTSGGQYIGDTRPDVCCIEPSDLFKFAEDNEQSLPSRVRRLLCAYRSVAKGLPVPV